MRPRQAPGFPGTSLGFCPVSLCLARPKGISMMVTFVTRPGPNGLACGPLPGGSWGCCRTPSPLHSSSHSRVPDLFLTCMPCARMSVRSAHTSVRSVEEVTVKEMQGSLSKRPRKGQHGASARACSQGGPTRTGTQPLSPAWVLPCARQPSRHSIILGTDQRRKENVSSSCHREALSKMHL